MKWLNLLERADYQGSTEPTLETLSAIQQKCLLNIPFENLDIHLGRKIELDAVRVYQKVVKSNRGGFCYELNELLLQCLTELGFSCTRVEARVNFCIPPRPFDHQVCLVQLEDLWLSDIGFGDSSITPINLSHNEEQFDGESFYRVNTLENGLFEIFHALNPSPDPAQNQTLNKDEGEKNWKSILTVNPTPQPWSAFAEMCVHQQSAPESNFLKKRMCTKRTPVGRITLTGNTLKSRSGGETSELTISEEDYLSVLDDLFNMHMDKVVWINPLEQIG